MYTSPELIQIVKQVLGTIDLDPASCEAANRIVGATAYYSKRDNGLFLPWHGNVYLNPPYGRTVIHWVKKLTREYEQGTVQEAITLLRNDPTTQWFKMLRQYPGCLLGTRQRFTNGDNIAYGDIYYGLGDGKEYECSLNHVTFSNVVFYLGPHEETFCRVFDPHGTLFFTPQWLQSHRHKK